MNPYQFEVTCDVCGEPGMGDSRASAAQWLAGSQVRHTDPRVCAMNLERKRLKLEKREAALKEKEGGNENIPG